MENLKQVLDNLTKHDMHVHVINKENGFKEYCGVEFISKFWKGGIPLAWWVSSTHFIMKGADIIHMGNLVTIESFALRLK